jgi:hypothetical protein
MISPQLRVGAAPRRIAQLQRSVDERGSYRDTIDEVHVDLGGRITHLWVQTEDGRMSTLDLVGDGLTLFTGPDTEPPPEASASAEGSAPVNVRGLPAMTARALGIAPVLPLDSCFRFVRRSAIGGRARVRSPGVEADCSKRDRDRARDGSWSPGTLCREPATQGGPWGMGRCGGHGLCVGQTLWIAAKASAASRHQSSIAVVIQRVSS